MRSAPRLSAVLAVVSLASCAAEAPPAAPPPRDVAPPSAPAAIAPSAPPPREDGRLPATVIPQRYALSLRIDPSGERFSGIATIQVDVPAPTWHVVLNARDLRVARALARSGGGELAATTTARPSHGGTAPEELVLTFSRPLPAGPAQLEITYDAPFADDLAGLYRVREGGAYYAYSQFEATDARRAFPCFDEPDHKTPYDVSVAAPRGLIALTNAPEVSHEDTADGLVLHRFQTSRPLPSYLVAFAVGDFDVVQGQASPFPIRAVTTRGHGALTARALEAAAALVARLGDYFDVRYPYEKLDLVAVPDFAAGAMENPGLITFRDSLLLLDPAHTSTTQARHQAETIAHELAHQWFGDLVTPAWWDDLWLNEGFATWAEAKMVDAWRPTFGAVREQVADAQRVMDTDALRAAHAIRQPVRSTGDVLESFDDITYDKGAAVLRMLESWLGPDTFRRGVQRYVHDHAWKSARANDLFDALDFVSAQKVGKLAGAFLDQAGVPSVSLRWECAHGDTKVQLHEAEWRPLGGAGAGAGGGAAHGWTLPVCVTTDASKGRTCFTFGPSPIERDLGARCPTWLYPNADEAGYYRFVLDRAQLLSLARASRALDSLGRLGLLSNAWAGVRQGALAPADVLDVLALFDGEQERLVVEQIADTLDAIDRTLVTGADRPAFRAYVAARFARRKAALGWEAARGSAENDEAALARRATLGTMGMLARDERTLDEAERYAQRWLHDPSSVPADTASLAVPLASLRAGASRLAELRAAARDAKTPGDRIVALSAMGTFEDVSVLQQALDLTLTDEVRASELLYVLRPALRRESSAAALLAWEREHWSALDARMDTYGRPMLVAVAGAMCSRAGSDEARAFFGGQGAAALEGARRALDERLEEADLCAALREHGAGAVAEYFTRRR